MDNITVELSASNRKNKKWRVVIFNDGKKIKTINFGATGYSDFPDHQNVQRKYAYISRHKKRENWSKGGILTAGFWSRWLLWNKKTIKNSIKHIQNKFNVKINFGTPFSIRA